MDALEAWRQQVGADTLRATLDDGVVVEPLYPEAASSPVGRGVARPWRVAQAYADRDPSRVATAIATDVALGLEAAWVRLDPALRARACVDADAPGGTVVRTVAEVDALLAAGARVVIDAGANGAAMFDLVSKAPEPTRAAGVLCDPLGAWAQLGGLGVPVQAALEEAADTTVRAMAAVPGMATLLASGVVYHDAGASPAVELGAALATAITYVHATVSRGASWASAAPAVVMQLAVDSDVFVSIAKLRAARWLWRGVLAKAGATNTDLQLSARTAWRNRTRHDPWGNLLRGTVEAFAGATAGADELLVQPLDEPIGPGTDDARRWAIGTQHVLRAEAHIDAVDDPAAGCGYVEALTRALAEQAWGFVRDVKRQGGMQQALEAGWIQERVAESAAARAQALQRGRISLTGVSLYPHLSEPRLDDRGDPDPAGASGTPPPVAASTAIGPLRRARLAVPFERLRDRSDAYAATHDGRPTALLATLGPGAEHRARLDFARSAVGVGGFESEVVALAGDRAEPLPAALLGVVCGADARLASEGAAAVEALRSAGAARVLVVAPPGDATPFGADAVVGPSTDLPALMLGLQQELGVQR